MPVGFNSSPPTVFTVFLGVASIPTCNVDATYFRPKALMATLKSNWRVSALYYYYHLLLLLMAGGAAVHRESSAGLWNLRFIRSSLTAGQYFPPGRHCLVPVLLQAMTECFPMRSRVSGNEE